uniref:Cystatin domain-containing protein n=1 Tax=viral metagenome TaxID=1070528 RepID=A0A6C0ADL7_9ZZZZ
MGNNNSTQGPSRMNGTGTQNVPGSSPSTYTPPTQSNGNPLAALETLIMGQPTNGNSQQGMNGTPPQMNGTPSQMNGTPPQMNGTPSQMNGTPSQMNGTPPQMNGTPPQMNGTPSQMNGTPSQMNGTPSQMNGPPHQMNGTPSQMNGNRFYQAPQMNGNGSIMPPNWTSNGTPQQNMNVQYSNGSIMPPNWTPNGTPQQGMNGQYSNGSIMPPNWTPNGTPQQGMNPNAFYQQPNGNRMYPQQNMNNFVGGYQQIDKNSPEALNVTDFMVSQLFPGQNVTYKIYYAASQVVTGNNYMIIALLNFPNGRSKFIKFTVYDQFGNLSLTDSQTSDDLSSLKNKFMFDQQPQMF